MDALTSKTITKLRLPLAVMVVFIHSFGYQPYNINWSHLSGMDFYNLVRIACSHVIPHIAVPAFFLISGYLFFAKAKSVDWNFYKIQWKKRIRTLLVPYLIWNVIALFFDIIYRMREGSWTEVSEYAVSNCTLRIFWDINNWGGNFHNIFGQTIPTFSGPYNFPLWYLKYLILVVAMTPLLYWLIQKTKGFFVDVIGVIWLLNINIMLSHGFVDALFFFSLGAYCAIFKKEFVEFCEKGIVFLVPIWGCLICASIYYDGAHTEVGALIYPFMVSFGVFAFIGIIARMVLAEKDTDSNGRLSRMVDFAAKNTFFIYLSHAAFGLTTAQLILGKLFCYLPGTSIFMTIKYLLYPFVTIGVCLVVLYILNRFFPRFTKVLIGKRQVFGIRLIEFLRCKE